MKIWLEDVKWCCCIKDPFAHVYEAGDTHKVRKGKRKKLSPGLTVLDMMTGKNGADKKTFWQLVGAADSVCPPFSVHFLSFKYMYI